MEQTRAINALAPFVALSKAASSPRAAADLVIQATSAQNTYIFAELLQTPPLQALRQDPQYASHYKLLEVFAWGTWEDYQADASSLPPLSDVQAHKLRLLTLLTLASQCSSSSQLTYANLQEALSLSSSIELEHLVTDAIYASLLTGTLNPAQQVVAVNSVAPLRDLAPASVGAMVAELEAWSQRCEGVLKGLESEIAKVKVEAARKARTEAVTASQIEKAAFEAESTGNEQQKNAAGLGVPRGLRGGGGGGGRNNIRLDYGDGNGEDAMDVDGFGASGTGGTKRTRGIFGRKK